jgi:hypothetical protein
MAGGFIDRMFGSGARHANAPQAPVPAAYTPPTQGNMPEGSGVGAPGTGTTAANGTNPTNGQGATGGNADQNKSPFAEFEKLWEPVTGPDGKPVVVTNDPLYTVDNNKVLEAARKTDFKSFVTQEHIAAMQKGGSEAVAAMLDAMQAMSQATYANAAVAATKIAEQGITKALSQAEGRLPGLIRNQQVSESLIQNNPALKNPAVAPLVEMARNQFIQKNPTATPAEIQESVNRYFMEVSNAFNPTARQEAQRQQEAVQKQGSEWDRFFGVENDTGAGNPGW